MADFEHALAARLARNDELEQERIAAESEMDAADERARAAAEQRERELGEARVARHAELAERLQALLRQLRGVDDVLVHGGWSESGEELIAKFAWRGRPPRRTLGVTLDRDDDQVLTRWHSDVGDALELYHLLEFTPEMLGEVVLQVVDQQLWHGASRTPTFPGNPD